MRETSPSRRMRHRSHVLSRLEPMPDVGTKASRIDSGKRCSAHCLSAHASPRIDGGMTGRVGGNVIGSWMFAAIALRAGVSFRSICFGAARQVRAHHARVDPRIHAAPENSRRRLQRFLRQAKRGPQRRHQSIECGALARDVQSVVRPDPSAIVEGIPDLDRRARPDTRFAGNGVNAHRHQQTHRQSRAPGHGCAPRARGVANATTRSEPTA
jgi:hypothetical protein